MFMLVKLFTHVKKLDFFEKNVHVFEKGSHISENVHVLKSLYVRKFVLEIFSIKVQREIKTVIVKNEERKRKRKGTKTKMRKKLDKKERKPATKNRPGLLNHDMHVYAVRKKWPGPTIVFVTQRIWNNANVSCCTCNCTCHKHCFLPARFRAKTCELQAPNRV